jgi:outer membrane murein-binding lipoprotein Lpp
VSSADVELLHPIWLMQWTDGWGMLNGSRGGPRVRERIGAAMTLTHRRPDNHPNCRRHATALTLLAILIGGGLLAGCGSSKPGYCDPVSKTENAVKSLPTVQDVKEHGVGTLTSAISTLKQNATTAINQAKSDFSSQTTALKNSVDALSSTVKQLTSPLSAATLAQLAAELSTVRSAAKSLQSAVSSKCG